jgi:hypothetical protein
VFGWKVRLLTRYSKNVGEVHRLCPRRCSDRLRWTLSVVRVALTTGFPLVGRPGASSTWTVCSALILWESASAAARPTLTTRARQEHLERLYDATLPDVLRSNQPGYGEALTTAPHRSHGGTSPYRGLAAWVAGRPRGPILTSSLLAS